MATLLELAKIKHHVIRSDGAKFLDGERNDALDTSWLTVNSSGRVTLGPGLYDELLVVKGEVSDDQIKAWASMGAPFYDSAGNIVYEGAGGQIEMDHKGLRFIRKADNEVTLQMDIETGSAYFKGDITGATGKFSGELEAEKIIGSIAEFGGLSADIIKAGTITADRLAMPTVRLNIPSVTLDYQQKTNAVINLTDITFVGLPMIGSNMNVPQFPGIGESNAIEVRDSSGENSGRAYIEMFSKNTVVLILKNESAFGSTRSYEYGSAFIELTYMEN